MQPVSIQAEGVRRSFGRGVVALRDVRLEVPAGEMVALLGSSGSGKSTLLRVLAGLLAADAHPSHCGRVRVGERLVQENGRLRPTPPARRAEIAFIFQQFNLVPRLTLLDNVLMGALARMPRYRSLTGWFSREERERGMAALARVGIADQAGQRASQLSGGQQQRAAIARALLQGARVLMADEPIASLDPVAARRVMDLLARVNREDGVTVLVSLHQVDIARAYCRRIVALAGEVIRSDGPPESLDAGLLREIYAGDPDAAPSSLDPIPVPAVSGVPS